MATESDQQFYTGSQLAKIVGVGYTTMTSPSVRKRLAEAGFDVSEKPSKWQIPINDQTRPLLPSPRAPRSRPNIDAKTLEQSFASVRKQLKKVERDIDVTKRRLTELRNRRSELQREQRKIAMSVERQAETKFEEAKRLLAEAEAEQAQVATFFGKK